MLPGRGFRPADYRGSVLCLHPVRFRAGTDHAPPSIDGGKPVSENSNDTGLSEEHQRELITDELPTDPEQVAQEDVDDFPTE